jgi:hypothetical protein
MANDFNPNVGEKIKKEDAKKRIEKYDKEHRKDKAKDTKSVFMGRDNILKILKDPKCAGISFFLTSNYSEFAGKDVVDLVMVGTQEDGQLLWPDDTASLNDTDNGSYNTGKVCPPTCPI